MFGIGVAMRKTFVLDSGELKEIFCFLIFLPLPAQCWATRS
jgi:hypothetical protein